MGLLLPCSFPHNGLIPYAAIAICRYSAMLQAGRNPGTTAARVSALSAYPIKRRDVNSVPGLRTRLFIVVIIPQSLGNFVLKFQQNQNKLRQNYVDSLAGKNRVIYF